MLSDIQGDLNGFRASAVLCSLHGHTAWAMPAGAMHVAKQESPLHVQLGSPQSLLCCLFGCLFWAPLIGSGSLGNKSEESLEQLHLLQEQSQQSSTPEGTAAKLLWLRQSLA